jgi:hypothetical protein
MVESFGKTKSMNDTELMIYVDENDPKINKYRQLPKNIIDRITFGPHKWVSQVCNYFATEIVKNADYYIEINDDMVFTTPEWDKRLIQPIIKNNGWGVVMSNNQIDPCDERTKNVGQAMISGNIVRTLEYLFYPPLRHLGCDTVLWDWSHTAEILFYDPETIIDHFCWHDGLHGFGARAPEDDNSKFVYGNEEQNYWETVAKPNWLRDKSKHINKLRVAMGKPEIEIKPELNL